MWGWTKDHVTHRETWENGDVKIVLLKTIKFEKIVETGKQTSGKAPDSEVKC